MRSLAPAGIRLVATPSSKTPERLQSLIGRQVVIIASWPSTDATSITIQDFSNDGGSFIPVFSSQERFQAETRGSGFESKGVSIDAHLLASMLTGTERIVLDPGSSAPVSFQADDLKALVDSRRPPR